MLSIAMALGARNETGSAFNRDVLNDHRQLLLYAMAFLFTFLPTRLPFLQEWLGLTHLTGEQWMIAIVLAFALLLIDEVVKVFLRRRHKQAA
jgi:Ca2+-transporting ATPase